MPTLLNNLMSFVPGGIDQTPYDVPSLIFAGEGSIALVNTTLYVTGASSSTSIDVIGKTAGEVFALAAQVVQVSLVQDGMAELLLLEGNGVFPCTITIAQSPLWIIVGMFCRIFQERINYANIAASAVGLRAAVGLFLDWWGANLGILRITGEPDDLYVRRIIGVAIGPNVNNIALTQLFASLGYGATVVDGDTPGTFTVTISYPPTNSSFTYNEEQLTSIIDIIKSVGTQAIIEFFHTLIDYTSNTESLQMANVDYSTPYGWSEIISTSGTGTFPITEPTDAANYILKLNAEIPSDASVTLSYNVNGGDFTTIDSISPAIIQKYGDLFIWTPAQNVGNTTPLLYVSFDSSYPGGSLTYGSTLAAYLETVGFTLQTAVDTQETMEELIANNTARNSTFVLANGMTYDTINQNMNASDLIVQYMKMGGRIVWAGDIPFYYQGHADQTYTTYGNVGQTYVLNLPSVPNTNHYSVSLTGPGKTLIGNGTSWTSYWSQAAGDVDMVLAYTADNTWASSWIKTFTGSIKNGFYRLVDSTISGADTDYNFMWYMSGSIYRIAGLTPFVGSF